MSEISDSQYFLKPVEFFKLNIIMNGQSIKYISLSEAAKLTSYSQEYVSLLCRQKKMKGTKIGRNWVTTKEWVERYINKTKGNGQNIIPVKIKSAKGKEFNSEASEPSSLSFLAENTPMDDSIPPVIGKLILTAIICSLFVSGFIFLQLGLQKGAIKTNPSQAVKGASASIAEGIIFASDSLDAIKNKSAEFAAGDIIAFGGSLENISDNGKELSAEAKNNLENFAKPIQKKLTRLSYSKDIILSAVFGGMNINKSERGRVAGVEDLNEGGGAISDERIDLTNEEKKGMVVVPLEGDKDSPENIDMINRISSSFSDDVDVRPNEDGISGMINPKNNPEENYLYLMVPVKE